MKVSGVILSGGQSSRMGKTKSLLPLGNQTVIDHVMRTMCSYDECFVIANDLKLYAGLECPVYPDHFIDKGPLAGLESALSHCQYDVCAIAACDTPFVHMRIYDELIGQLEDNDAVIPVIAGQMHPLSGVYRKSVHTVVRQQLLRDERQIRRVFDHIKVHYVTDFNSVSREIVDQHFFNMNTPEQYERALEIYKL
ncbi:molybdenum cofactor guanylyltransferase [Lentibacillus saliphilus]|uniref:molybdenum cofactor guanylyltransferase n=1 Tax=Lentibacillus saliphilus TaxID=2737028 RepID=UPI001C2FD5CC|nr:molybdenum cofactor guanylyltransferase [Lentibacillus saliphilus]